MSLPLFLIPVLTGSLVIHLLWPVRNGMALPLKVMLGVGMGLGINSIIFFLSLLIAPGQFNVLAIQIVLLVVLLIMVFLRERAAGWPAPELASPSLLQRGFLAATAILVIFSGLVYINLTIARPQGSFDTWGIWNRAARFIYRDPENWQAALSPDLYWLMHADYPLLIPLNVAWGWEALGLETNYIPIMQSALFSFATIGLLFASIGLVRSWGQASLAALALMGAPVFFFTGYGQIADVPAAFYVMAASVLIYLYFVYKQSALLFLAGFMAGLAAWTKNEGLLFVVAGLLAVILASRKDFRRPMTVYLAGLLVPLVVVLYFKAALAPASEFTGGNENLSAKITDLSRYWFVLKALPTHALSFAGWPFSIFIQLTVYAFIVRFDSSTQPRQGIQAVAAIVILQLTGYCAAYIITPYDLAWHVDTSLGRLLLQLYPTGLFLYFSLATEPEKLFQPPTALAPQR